MRIIAGKHRSRILKEFRGRDVRPTSDRAREALFNIIRFRLEGCSFLDLYCGTGAIGIEAISRGARRAVFVDNAPKSIRCIEENLAHCKFTEEGVVIASDYMSALNRLRNAGYHFSVVFMDPPYNHGFERKAMDILHDMDYVDAHTLFIIEADLDDDLTEDIEALGYTLVREKLYKTNKHVFFRKK